MFQLVSGPRIFLLCLAVGLFLTNNALADDPGPMSAQTLTAPSGPASLSGLGESFSPNMSTGTGNYSVPIQVAPGIVTPSVSLNYTGGGGKGPLGMSFSMPVLRVYRTKDKGLPEYTEDDRFAVEGPGLNDELVRVNDERGWYRLKNEGAFALFVRDTENDTWTIRMPSGETSYLGESLQSRQQAGGRTYGWYIERYADLFGHEISYNYATDQGYLYLDTIEYQLEALADYRNTVAFSYETRPDRFVDYSYGAEIVCAKRMTDIQVWQGSRLLREYDLTYEDTFLFSLLTQIEMLGEQGLAMPPVKLTYVGDSDLGGEFVAMKSLPPLEGLINGAATIDDMNGDALPDLLYGTPGDYYYYENLDGKSWASYPTHLGGSPDVALNEETVLLADIDGNGYRDVIHSHGDRFRYYPGGDIEKGVLQRFGPAATLDITGEPGFAWDSYYVKMTDLNFDGRVDLLYQKPGNDAQIINLKSDELVESPIPELPADVDFYNPNLELSDFNGDGVLDFVLKDIWPDSSDVRVWFGKGFGKYAAEQSMTNVPVGVGDEFYLEDVNNDGQTDLLQISGSYVAYCLNDGQMRFSGKQGSFSAAPSTRDTLKVLFADMNGNGTNDVVWLTVDYQLKYLDLLGHVELGLLRTIDNSMGGVTRMEYRSSTEYQVDAKLAGDPWSTPLPIATPVVSKIITTDSLDVLGLEANVSTTLIDYRDGYYDGVEREFRGFAKVTDTTLGDEFHPSQITETWMHVGRNPETGEDEEILKGEAYLQKTEDAEGNLFSTVETKWKRRWMCQGEFNELSVRILPDCDPEANNDAAKDDLIAFAVVTESLSGSWEKTTSPRWVGSATVFNEWGDEVRSESYGEVVFAGGRQPGDPFDLSAADILAGDDEIASENDYIYDVDKWLLSIPYQSRTLDLAGNILGQSRTYYDGADFVGLPLGYVEKGLAKRQEVWLKSPGAAERWITTSRTAHNTDGLVIATKDANDNLSELEYDIATGMFPTVERMYVDIGPLEFTANYDRGLGAVTAITDLNGNTSRFYYDGLGRLTDVVDPLSTLGLPTAHYDYEYGTPDYPISTTTARALVNRDIGLYRTSWQYSDGMGRGRLSKTEAESPHGFIGAGWARMSPQGTVTHVYDSFASTTAAFEPAPSFAPVTVSYYDAVGRATEVYPPATEEHGWTHVVTQYYPFETRVYDERDTSEGTWLYPAITRVDGQGRVREIVKHNDVNGSFTELVWTPDYNTLGSIVGFTDPQGNRREYTYDNLQRLLRVQDPNVGQITYDYDDVNNLIERVDTLGQTQTFTYGKANRLMSAHIRNDANGRADYSYNYHYDEPAAPLADAKNLRGKLASVEWPTGTRHASYDELNRPVVSVQSLWNGQAVLGVQQRDTFRQEIEYNAAGQVIGQTIPGGLELDYYYNTRSLLTRLAGGFEGDTRSIFSGIQYDHRGAATRTDARNGTSTCSWYDDRARLKGIMAGPSASTFCGDKPTTSNPAAFQHAAYQYSPSGLIAGIADLTGHKPDIPRFNATYEYDRLSQLTAAHTSKGATFYSYDTIQSLVSRTSDASYSNRILGDFQYGERGAGPNQLTTAGKKRFQYNELGQMKRYNGFDLQFDIQGRLVEATKPGQVTIEYYYGTGFDKKLTIIRRSGEPTKIYQYVSQSHQIRDGEQTWFLSAGHGQAEITKSKGLELDLNLLDELSQYVKDPSNHKKPLPAEYLDPDGDGDDQFDNSDLETALQSYWSDSLIGQDAELWRYYHKDHLRGKTLVTDSAGEVISTRQYHPYGQTAEKSGTQPTYGFAGGETEEEEELGLIQFGARWYASDLGRWISADPLLVESPGAAVGRPLEGNLYSYAGNNPVNWVDPSGFAKTAQTASGGQAQKTKKRKKSSITRPKVYQLRSTASRRTKAIGGGFSNRNGRRLTANSRFAALQSRILFDAQKTAVASHAPPGTYAHQRQHGVQRINQYTNTWQDRRVEVDHIPTDGSQRGNTPRGSRQNQLATLTRPAFAVPRDLHRAHPTTRGGTDFDQNFHNQETTLFNGGGGNNYFAAAQHHLGGYRPLMERNAGSVGRGYSQGLRNAILINAQEAINNMLTTNKINQNQANNLNVQAQQIFQ